MQLRFSKDGEEFRDEARTWLAEHKPTDARPEAGPAMEQFIADFHGEYGRDPESAFNAMGWDTIQVIARLWRALA